MATLSWLPLLYPKLNKMWLSLSFSFHVHKEKSKPPSIHIYPPIPGNSLSLTCMARGFSPAENDVLWLKNGNAISEDDYVNTPAVKEKRDESYFLYSKLTIPESDWNDGNTFSCMLVHEALDDRFTQRNIAKTSGKRWRLPSTCIVLLDLSLTVFDPNPCKLFTCQCVLLLAK